MSGAGTARPRPALYAAIRPGATFCRSRDEVSRSRRLLCKAIAFWLIKRKRAQKATSRIGPRHSHHGTAMPARSVQITGHGWTRQGWQGFVDRACTAEYPTVVAHAVYNLLSGRFVNARLRRSLFRPFPLPTCGDPGALCNCLCSPVFWCRPKRPAARCASATPGLIRR